MNHQKIKNLILVVMVVVCVYLSSLVWLQLPDLFSYSEDSKSSIEETVFQKPIWDIVRPEKHVISYNDNFTMLYSDEGDELWEDAIEVLKTALEGFGGPGSSYTGTPAYPARYIKMDFAGTVPIEIFTEGMDIVDDAELIGRISGISSITIDLDNSSRIYIYDGDTTHRIESRDIDAVSIIDKVKAIDYDMHDKYSYNEKIIDKTLRVPVPIDLEAYAPVFVASELNIADTDAIDSMAKDYFWNDYDYVRTVREVSGITYMYKNEKVLKVTSEGQLSFFDVSGNYEGNSDVFESFMAALSFMDNFLGIPENSYLSRVDTVQEYGTTGYIFEFSYKTLNRPTVFSKYLENPAIRIEVFGRTVVNYSRFLRKIDEVQSSQKKLEKVMPVTEVIMNNLRTDESGGSLSPEGIAERPKVFSMDMIENINNIYLAYFDLSRVSTEQRLYIVWVIEVNGNKYIFNAVTGASVEE